LTDGSIWSKVLPVTDRTRRERFVFSSFSNLKEAGETMQRALIISLALLCLASLAFAGDNDTTARTPFKLGALYPDFGCSWDE
jgi:hypothetical protein